MVQKSEILRDKPLMEGENGKWQVVSGSHRQLLSYIERKKMESFLAFALLSSLKSKRNF